MTKVMGEKRMSDHLIGLGSGVCTGGVLLFIVGAIVDHVMDAAPIGLWNLTPLAALGLGVLLVGMGGMIMGLIFALFGD